MGWEFTALSDARFLAEGGKIRMEFIYRYVSPDVMPIVGYEDR